VSSLLNSTPAEEAIQARIYELREEIRTQEKLLEAEKQKRASVKPGDFVISKGQTYRVVEVQVFNYGKDWVKANPKKRDGTFGTAVRHLYENWTKDGS
jgi:hypothetical protein